MKNKFAAYVIEKNIGIISFILFIAFISSLISTFYFKQLTHDGPYWIYHIIDTKEWFLPIGHARYSTLIPQIPALIHTQFSNSILTTTWLFCLGYAMFPFVAFYISIKNLSDEDSFLKLIFIYIIVLTCLPSSAFCVAVVNEAIIIFMLFFCYIIKNKTLSPLIVIVFSIMLLLTYESAFIYFPLIIYILHRERKLNSILFLILLIAFLFRLYDLYFVVMAHNDHQFFLVSLKSLFMLPLLYVLAVFPILLLSEYVNHKMIKNGLYLLMISIVGYVFYKLFLTQHFINYSAQAYLNRIWVIPGSFVIVLTLYEVCRKNGFQFSFEKSMILILILLPGLSFEIVSSFKARLAHNNLMRLVSTHQGCSTISVEEYTKNFMDISFDIIPLSLPERSVLYGNSLRPKAILFTPVRSPDGRGFINQILCNKIENKYKYYSGWNYLIVEAKRFDFREL